MAISPGTVAAAGRGVVLNPHPARAREMITSQNSINWSPQSFLFSLPCDSGGTAACVLCLRNDFASRICSMTRSRDVPPLWFRASTISSGLGMDSKAEPSPAWSASGLIMAPVLA